MSRAATVVTLAALAACSISRRSARLTPAVFDRGGGLAIGGSL